MERAQQVAKKRKLPDRIKCTDPRLSPVNFLSQFLL